MITAAGALLFSTGGAFAYFLSEATGSGNTHVTTAAAPSTTALSITAAPSLEGGTGDNGLTTTGLLPSASETNGNWQIAVWAARNSSVSYGVRVSHIAVSVATDGSGNVLNAANNDAPVVGCLASWFQLGGHFPTGTVWTDDNPGTSGTNTMTSLIVPIIVPASSVTYIGTDVWLQDSGTDQSACEGVSPEITLTVS